MTNTNIARHKRPWKEGSTTVKVPLWTPTEYGQELEGRFRVPRRLAHAQPHTNERHEFDRIVGAALRRWAQFRERMEWYMVGRPKVVGPYEPPTHGSENHARHVKRAEQVIGKGTNITPVIVPETDDYVFYVARARFTRERPLYIGLDDFLHINDIRKLHRVPEDEDFHPYNDTKGTGEDSGWVDPMKYAEERRKAKGIDARDYHIGWIGDPL